MQSRVRPLLLLSLWLSACAAAPPAPETPPPSPEVPVPEAAAASPSPAPAAGTGPGAGAAVRKEKPARKKKTAAGSLKEAQSRAEDRLKELKKREKRAQESAAPQPAPDTGEVAEKYERLLDLPGTPAERKPEILLRLAELRFREEEAALRQVYEAGTEGDVAPGEKYPKTIGFYRRLADEYPQSSQALTAFYNLGYLYAEEGEMVLSARAYGEVLKREPNSAYAVEIHMRLGEAAFSLGTYKEAVTHYKAVLAGGRAEYVDKALYKLGWSHYKLDDYKTAVETFSRILDSGQSSAENLRAETIDIMGRCFVEWGGTEGVTRYLAGREAGKNYGDRLYKKLGDLYAEASRFPEAVTAYARAVDAFPLSDLALDIEKGIIASYSSLRDVEAVNTRRQGWADRYAPGTEWDKANGARFAAQRDELLENGLRLAILYRHSRAQRGDGKLDTALALYKRYDELFGMGREEGYEMAYGHAQALKEDKRYAEAAKRYLQVAESGKFSSHREEAGYRRIEMLDSARKENSVYFEEFLKAHERYVEQNPASAQVPKILFALGELTFEAERFSEARSAFGRVAAGYPAHELAPEAVERMARCWFREGVYASAEQEARRALTFSPVTDTKERLLKLISFSILKQAETAEAEKRLADAVTHFFRLSEEFPEGDVAQVSLYRAAENLKALGRVEEAAALYRRLADTYKGGKFAESALTLSSEILSSLGDWRGVGQNYEDLYHLKPDAPEAASHLFRAAVAREKAGMGKEAAALFDEFVRVFPAEPRKAQALYRRGQLLKDSGEEAAALDCYRAAWATQAEGPEAAYRAKSALALGEKELSQFTAVELKGNLKTALAKKEKLLDQSLGFLVDAASLPFPDTLAAALYRCGEAFEHMKTAILESERPAGMNDEEKEQYQFLLEEKAFPLEEQAVEYYRRGVKAVRLLKAHNEWVDRTYARLEVIQPWAYQRSEQASAAWIAPEFPRKVWERVK